MKHNSVADRFDLAITKLLLGQNYEGGDPEHALSLLSARFAVFLCIGNPMAAEFVEKAVAGHMRVCVGISPDRSWMFTQYSSEPFLAFVAGVLLHTANRGNKPDEALVAALETLWNTIQAGMIDLGQLGELASRILLLLCKDYIILATNRSLIFSYTASQPKLESPIPFCKPIPLLSFLKSLLGEDVAIRTKQGHHLERVFSNARVNFSHWVTMDRNISSKKRAGKWE